MSPDGSAYARLSKTMRSAYSQRVARITTSARRNLSTPLGQPSGWRSKAQQRAFWVVTVGGLAGGAALAWLLTR
jgi:hypothetical protein